MADGNLSLIRDDRKVTPTVTILGDEDSPIVQLPVLELLPAVDDKQPEVNPVPIAYCSVTRRERYHECKHHAVFLKWS